jgi:hypothetical protein
MSGEPRLEVSDQGQGLINLVGDPAALPASGGGLLAVRRFGDEHWLTGAGQWQPGRPQWFPFGRETPRPGTTVLEVAAAPLLDLFASPPAEALSVRLRFPARAGQDAQELDLDLRLPGAAQPVAAPASPEPSADDIPASAPATDPGSEHDDTPVADAAPDSGITEAVPLRPEVGQPAETAVASDATSPPTVAHAEGAADTPGNDLERTTVSRGSELAAARPGTDRPEVPAVITAGDSMVLPNDHGARATPKNVSRVRHDRFPHPNPLPEGEGDVERATRDFQRKGEARAPEPGQWPRIALAAIPSALLLALLTWWLWPDGDTPGPDRDQPKVRDRAYVADLLAQKPPAAKLYSEAEEADAEGQCNAAILLYRAAAKGKAALAGRLGGKYDPQAFVPSPCIKQPSSSSAQVWYEKAAEAGEAVAQRRLGELMLDDGAQGVIRRQAIKWLRKAAAGGDAVATQRLQEIGEG